MESVMRYRCLLLVTGLLCASAAAQSVAPPSASDHWSTLSPARSSKAAGGYKDTLSTAAGQAQRFNFN